MATIGGVPHYAPEAHRRAIIAKLAAPTQAMVKKLTLLRSLEPVHVGLALDESEPLVEPVGRLA
jgi:hypothetical protein